MARPKTDWEFFRAVAEPFGSAGFAIPDLLSNLSKPEIYFDPRHARSHWESFASEARRGRSPGPVDVLVQAPPEGKGADRLARALSLQAAYMGEALKGTRLRRLRVAGGGAGAPARIAGLLAEADPVYLFASIEAAPDAADDLSPEPVSTLGLGPRSRSRIYGRVQYADIAGASEDFDPARDIYAGSVVSEEFEKLRFVLLGLHAGRRVSSEEYARRFGKGLEADFGPAIDLLSSKGRLGLRNGEFHLRRRAQGEPLLAALAFAGRSRLKRDLDWILQDHGRTGRERLESLEGRAGTGGHRPRSLELYIGSNCNNRCTFCKVGQLTKSARSRTWLPLELAKAELRHFYDLGCRRAGFLGGEPTLYPHLVECVRYARSLGYETVCVTSNGLKYADPRFAQSLIDAGVTVFEISFHSHRPAVEDELTGCPGAFKKKLAGLRWLLQRQKEGACGGAVPFGVSVNPVLNMKNLPAIREQVLFFYGLGAPVWFNYIWPLADVQEDPGAIPTYRQAMPKVLELMELNERHLRGGVGFGDIPPCMLRWGGLEPTDERFARLAEKYLNHRSLLYMSSGGKHYDWQEMRRTMIKVKGKACRGCRYDAGCDGVYRTYASLHGTNEMKPIP